MAAKAGDSVSVHGALDEVVALHPVFVGGVVGEMGEGRHRVCDFPTPNSR